MVYRVVVNVYPGSMLARVYYNNELIGSIKGYHADWKKNAGLLSAPNRIGR